MIKTAIIIGLGLSTAVLGASTGYLAYERVQNHAAIRTLTKANEATSASINEIVDTYNQQLDSGKAFSAVQRADLTKQLDELVGDYNATSSALATTRAHLSGATESYKNFSGVVDQLNAANSRVAQLEAQAQSVGDIQKIVDQLNAANSKIVQLEAQLAAATAQ